MQKGGVVDCYLLYIFFRNMTDRVVNCKQVAVDNNDPQMCDFIESEFLAEQV